MMSEVINGEYLIGNNLKVSDLDIDLLFEAVISDRIEPFLLGAIDFDKFSDRQLLCIFHALSNKIWAKEMVERILIKRLR